jgi:hypothetical protein
MVSIVRNRPSKKANFSFIRFFATSTMSVEEGLPNMSIEQLQTYLASLETSAFPCSENAIEYENTKAALEAYGIKKIFFFDL